MEHCGRTVSSRCKRVVGSQKGTWKIANALGKKLFLHLVIMSGGTGVTSPLVHIGKNFPCFRVRLVTFTSFKSEILKI